MRVAKYIKDVCLYIITCIRFSVNNLLQTGQCVKEMYNDSLMQLCAVV